MKCHPYPTTIEECDDYIYYYRRKMELKPEDKELQAKLTTTINILLDARNDLNQTKTTP